MNADAKKPFEFGSKAFRAKWNEMKFAHAFCWFLVLICTSSDELWMSSFICAKVRSLIIFLPSPPSSSSAKSVWTIFAWLNCQQTKWIVSAAQVEQTFFVCFVDNIHSFSFGFFVYLPIYRTFSLANNKLNKKCEIRVWQMTKPERRLSKKPIGKRSNEVKKIEREKNVSANRFRDFCFVLILTETPTVPPEQQTKHNVLQWRFYDCANKWHAMRWRWPWQRVRTAEQSTNYINKSHWTQKKTATKDHWNK